MTGLGNLALSNSSFLPSTSSEVLRALADKTSHFWRSEMHREAQNSHCYRTLRISPDPLERPLGNPTTHQLSMPRGLCWAIEAQGPVVWTRGMYLILLGQSFP